MASRRRIYLIDGSGYIYRAFFALPPLTGPSGLPTNAVYGFTTMLLKLLNEVNPEYLTVVFDTPGRTFRSQAFAQYKAHRPPTPADLTAQVDLVHQVLAACRIPTLAIPGVEADDVIASMIERLGTKDNEYVVITADKDLMQLVGPRVRLWDTMRDKWTDEAAVEARFGVPPGQVVDVLALMGDSIDNVPGVKGIGEKTAMALVRELGNVEAILNRIAEVEGLKLRGAKAVAERLRSEADNARLSRELVLLRRDVELECTLDGCRLCGFDADALRVLFHKLGFQSLLPQLLDRSAPLAVQTQITASDSEIEQVLAALQPEVPLALVAVANEGPQVTAGAREIVLCQDDARAAVVPLSTPEQQRAVTGALTRHQGPLVAHDFKRDLLYLEASGMATGNNRFDVMIASYLLEATGYHSIDELAREVLGTRVEGFRETTNGTAAGATLLRGLYERFAPRLQDTGLAKLFFEVEMPLMDVLKAMERRGLRVDVERLRALSAEFTGRLDALMREIYALAGGDEFNINSAPQLRVVLFEKLKLPKQGVRKGKTGFSTDVDVLNRLARVHPLPAKILEYRALSKLKSTYVDALPAAVNPTTGRLHTTFNQTVAATGRLSSSDPNLQNIPIRGEEGKRIRETFIAAPGYQLLAADYSQIELRILAHLSQDPAFLDAFRREQDIHTRTAAEVFGVMPGLVTADMRRAAKVINFGIIYGMGPQRLSNELGIPLAEAQRYIQQYFERYAGVRSYMQSVLEQARVTGYVTTILGRRRGVPDLRSTERGVAQAAERVATNTPIQGSAADIIKVAMINVERRLHQDGMNAALVLQVHDELLLEVRDDEIDRVRDAVREEMEQVMQLAVALRVDIGVGATWAAAHR